MLSSREKKKKRRQIENGRGREREKDEKDAKKKYEKPNWIDCAVKALYFASCLC